VAWRGAASESRKRKNEKEKDERAKNNNNNAQRIKFIIKKETRKEREKGGKTSQVSDVREKVSSKELIIVIWTGEWVRP